MMRDPVARIISSYYYTIETFPNTYIQDMSLEAFGAGESIHRECNAQARRIAGFPREVANDLDNDALYERAVDNIEEHFTCVGLLSAFDASLIVMRHLLGWKLYPLYLREKTTSDRPRGKDIPRQVRESIAASNAVDQRLYEYVQSRLTQQIDAMGNSFERDLYRFRALNNVYQAAASPVVRLYRKYI